MTLSLSTAHAIKELVSNDVALREDLRNSTSPTDFITRLSAAAAAQGIDVDEPALARSLVPVFGQYAESGELADEDLEAVTGGSVMLQFFMQHIVPRFVKDPAGPYLIQAGRKL